VNVAGWSLLIAGLVLLCGQLVKPVDPQDEGQLLTYPWLIAHGWMPYRDMWMSYPPGIYLLLAGFLKAGFPGVPVERGIAVLAFLGTVTLVNRAMTHSWSRLSWLGVPTTFALMFCSSDVRAYPWLIAIPLFLWGLLLIKDQPNLAVALFFLAGTLRFEFTFAGLVAVLVLTVWPASNQSRRTFATASAALVASFILFYLVCTLLTSGAAFKDIFVDQIVPVEAARRIPLWPPQFGPLGMPFALVMLAAPGALVVAGLLLRKPFIIATNLAALSLLPHFFQRADASHLFSTSVIVIPWALISLIEIAHPEGWRDKKVISVSRDRAYRGAGMGLATIGLLAGVWGSLIVVAYAAYLSPLSPLSDLNISHFSALQVPAGSNTIVAWSAGEARDDRRVIAYLREHARSSDSVFIEPQSIASSYTMTDLYYPLAMTVRPATRYLEMQGGLEDQPAVQREITTELRACTWIVVLYGGRWYRGVTSDASAPQPAMYDRYIARHYRTVFSTSTYLVLRRAVSWSG
jgi:hypothetical protein